MHRLRCALLLLACSCAREHQYLTHEAAERVCVALASCALEDGSSGPGSCVASRVGADANEPGVHRCVLSAGTDCDAVRACVGVSVTPVPRCETTLARCEGDEVVQCVSAGAAGSSLVRRDCRAPTVPSGSLEVHSIVSEADTTCRSEPGAAAECIVGGTCDHEGSRCLSDGRVEQCRHGVIVARGVCGAGFECREHDGDARCVALGEPCEAAVCDERGLHVCGLDAAGGGRLWPALDCAAHGLRCDAHGGCVADEGECDPMEAGPGAPVCRGDVLVYCGVDARLHSYDCSAHGWLGCRFDTGRGPTCVPMAP